MAYCSNCGEKHQDNAKFCTNCGNAIPISTIEEPIEKPLEESKNKAETMSAQGGDHNVPEEHILIDAIEQENDDSTNSNKEYQRASLNLDQSKFESLFNPYPGEHLKGNERLYIGANIPSELIATFSRGYHRDFISKCTFHILHYGSKLNNFAIVKVEEDEWYLLISRNPNKGSEFETILLADKSGTNISWVELVGDLVTYKFSLNITFLSNGTQFKVLKWPVYSRAMGFKSLGSGGRRGMQESISFSFLLYKFLKTQVEDPALNRDFIKGKFKFYSGKSIEDSLKTFFWEWNERKKEIAKLLLSLYPDAYLRKYVEAIHWNEVLFSEKKAPANLLEFIGKFDPVLINDSKVEYYYIDFEKVDDGFAIIRHKNGGWYLLIQDHDKSWVLSFTDKGSMFIKDIKPGYGLNILVLNPDTNKENLIKTNLSGGAVNALKAFILSVCTK